MDLKLRQTVKGVVLPVKVAAGSRVAGIRGVQDGTMKVSVSVAPEKGKANQAILKLLADSLGVPKSSLEIVKGETSNRKQVLFMSLNVDDLTVRIERLQLS